MGQLRCHTIGAAICAGMVLATAAASGPQVEIQLPGKFGEFRVVNRGAMIQLNSTVKVQHETGGDWQDSPVTDLYLTASCAHGAVPDCVSHCRPKPVCSPSHGAVTTVPSQCNLNCNLDGPAPPGIYRYVVTSCDHKHQFFFGRLPKEGAIAGGVCR